MADRLGHPWRQEGLQEPSRIRRAKLFPAPSHQTKWPMISLMLKPTRVIWVLLVQLGCSKYTGEWEGMLPDQPKLREGD